ncbi:MAG: MarR family transcriptional regulator [Stellaceae bacterium]
MQLLRARDAVMQRFRPHLRRQGLTDQQGRVLRTLAEVTVLEMGALAAYTCVHPASLSRIIPGLARKALVRRTKAARDGRRVLVSITPRGRTAIAPIIRESTRIYADLAAEMGPAPWRELHRSLEVLIRAYAPEGGAANGSSRKSATRMNSSILGHAASAAASR